MPTNDELLKRRVAAVPRGVGHACPVFPARAKNAELWDVEGRRYIDFCGGIAVLNVGHCHPKVMAAAKAQIDAYTHPCFQVNPYEPYIELAERLNGLAPGDFAKKTIFLTTGAEAVENAVKIARAHTRRRAVVTFTGGFHGRTLMTLAMTGKVVPYKVGFGPFPGEVWHVPYPMVYHGNDGARSIEALQQLFEGDVAPEDVAAILIEPVLGEGGFHAAPAPFLRALRALCDEHGIVLVSDEIQSGIARSGRMFAIEWSGVAPDLITVAKSLGGGFPLSGVIGRAEIIDAPAPGGLGGTYAGNPVACAAGLAVLDVIAEENLLKRASDIGERISAHARAMANRREFDCIGDVRNLGALNAIELVMDRRTREPAKDVASRVTTRALENGLLLITGGLHANILRILVPLTASDAVVDEGLQLLEKSLLEAVEAR